MHVNTGWIVEAKNKDGRRNESETVLRKVAL